MFNVYRITVNVQCIQDYGLCSMYLRIDRNFCSVHEEITLRKGVYNLIEVISNEPNK